MLDHSVVVFDFDGTLVDSNHIKIKGFYDVIEPSEAQRNLMSSILDSNSGDRSQIFLEFLKSLNIKKRFKLKKNIANGNFYGKNLIYDLKKININDDIETIKTKSRAFYFPPFEPAYLIIKDNRYYITPNNKKLI